MVQWGSAVACNTNIPHWSTGSTSCRSTLDPALCPKAWKGSGRWPRGLDPCHSQGDPNGATGSWLLISAWPSPGHYRHLEGESADGRPSSFRLATWLPLRVTQLLIYTKVPGIFLTTIKLALAVQGHADQLVLVNLAKITLCEVTERVTCSSHPK